MADTRILLLQGGTSNEREVSLRSGANVAEWLRKDGYDVIVADPADAEFDLEKLTSRCDAVLPILHGAGGEDGVLQRQLEELGVPFLGSKAAACELTFDKAAYRAFMAEKGVLMPAGEVVDRTGFDSSALRQAPYVLKPIDGGSSVDVVIQHDLSAEPDAALFDELFMRYPSMLLEQLIEGPELTAGVLRDKVLPIILVVPPADETFDYQNKYNGRSQEIVNPEQIPLGVQRQAQELALQAHGMTDCRHLSRTDMIWVPDGKLYLLETNTLPGMTEQSLFPKMAAAAGIDMAALVKDFVELASKKRTE